MNIYESTTYGRRQGFVYLRYVAIFFFLISQLATYFVIVSVLEAANAALEALQNFDVIKIVETLVNFMDSGTLGKVLGIMRNLGYLVIPLYFVATVSFVLNLNRRGIVSITQRTALFAVLLIIGEFLIYVIILGAVTVLVAQIFTLIQEQYADIISVINDVIEVINGQTSFLPVDSAEEALAMAQNYVTTQLLIILTKAMPSFNIFLDQLLCLLMCIFFCTRPKGVNTKLKLIAFRLAGLIPVAYIAGAFIINALIQSGKLEPNILLLSLFPAKKLPHFLFIGCILACNKMFPIRTLGHTNGLADVYIPSKKVFRATPLVYETKAAARSRALFTSVFLSVCLLLLCAADFCLGQFPLFAKWGMGKSYYAALCIPFLFFFDGRKPTKKRDYSLFSIMYFAAILVIVAVYLFY